MGEKYVEAAKITGYDVRSLANMASLAGCFEVSRRRDNLTWSHHAVVAALDPEEQNRWLDVAATQRLSVADMRIELRSTERRHGEQQRARVNRRGRSYLASSAPSAATGPRRCKPEWRMCRTGNCGMADQLIRTSAGLAERPGGTAPLSPARRKISQRRNSQVWHRLPCSRAQGEWRLQGCAAPSGAAKRPRSRLAPCSAGVGLANGDATRPKPAHLFTGDHVSVASSRRS